jgi:predicted cation transporter
MMPAQGVHWLLGGIVVLVLLLPLRWRRVERNIEIFLLVMGALATTVASLWSRDLLLESLRAPWQISSVVLAVGLGFHFLRRRFDRSIEGLQSRVPPRALAFLIVASLGLLSSVVTAIIASLVLVEVIHVLRLDRREEVRLTVLACYSIGLGAALTPVGEPLSAIVTLKMRAGFWYIGGLIGPYIAVGILAVSLVAACMKPSQSGRSLDDTERRQTPRDVVLRAVRVYAFIAALVLLGAGVSPLVDRYITRLAAPWLFWANSVSAILDNATLAAAEIGPSLSGRQISGALLGLLISGGMLIPGNVPNIVAAHRLKIGSSEWARYAVPVGAIMMALCFAVWMALG